MEIVIVNVCVWNNRRYAKHHPDTVYYSGTESLWCGNWNHLVCRKWNCEVNHPSQSTVGNLGKKQKWCCLWFPWSQVQHNTSGPDNFRILGCLWAIPHRCICKCDVSFPLRAKTVWIPLRMNIERCRREQGRNSYPLECRLSAWRLSRQKPRKYCQLENVLVRVLNFRIRVLLHNICFFLP